MKIKITFSEEMGQFGAGNNGHQKALLCSLAMALDAGDIEGLRAKYGDNREAESFVYSEKLIPSITFKPTKDTKGLAVQKIEITPSFRTVS